MYERFSKRMQRERRCTYALLYAEYVDACEREHERPYAFSTLCAGLREWRRTQAAAAAPEWYPGEYMRTYWSHIKVKEGGAWPMFVAVMAYSDDAFACRAENTSKESWMRCCERAFRFFGGVPYVTDCTQSKLSRTARSTIEAFARHYRTVLYGARPKTERGAAHSAKPVDARNGSWVARQLADYLEGMGVSEPAEADRLIERKLRQLNAISAKGAPSRRDLFEEMERPQLLSLPAEGADFATWSTRVVGDDYHFTVFGTRYSADWRCAREEVRVCWTDGEVRAYSGGELVARHDRPAAPEGRCFVTDPSHRPPPHR